MGWTDLVSQTTSEYVDLKSISRRWSREVIEAATRVNYGQVGAGFNVIYASDVMPFRILMSFMQ